MKKLSIIDMGSNSIKVLIATLYSDLYYDIIREEKIPFRISQFLTDNQTLNEEGSKKLLDILSYFKHVSDYYDVDQILGIATEATRRLKNSKQLLANIKQQLQIHVELLPGETEAYYGYLATLHTIDLSDYLQIDIGGSSMEIVLVKNKKLMNAISLPLGAIATSKQFNLGTEISKQKEENFNQFIESSYQNISWLKEAIHLPIVGIGGTIRMISKIYRQSQGDTVKFQHQYKLTDKNIKMVYDLLAPLPLKDRLTIKGMTKERADIVLGCLMTVRSLMNYIDSKELVINRYGIRQGLLFKHLQLPTHSVLDYSLCNLLIHFKLDEHHNDRLKQSTLTIANQLGIKDSSSLNVLKVISKLHQIGQVISAQNINKHTFHLLMNLQINGIEPKEQLMAAYAIKFLDRFNIKTEHANLLTDEDLMKCRQYSLILQLASYLIALNQEFNALEVNDDTIDLQFSHSIPNLYVDKITHLSTSYEEAFHRQLIISQL